MNPIFNHPCNAVTPAQTQPFPQQSRPVLNANWLPRFILLVLVLSLTSVCTAKTPRQLDFYHTHTGKSLSIVYYDGDKYNSAALKQISEFLGDFRTGTVHAIAPETLDILYKLRTEFGGEGTFEIISAYRSPKTNSMLRNKSSGVAKRSLHMEGKAIDVRLRGVNTALLKQAALKLQLGGVGYYHKSDFIHVDNGRVRRW